MPFHSISPATGKVLRRYREVSLGRAKRALEEAHAAWQKWRAWPTASRAVVFHRTATLLGENKDHYARLITEEMGKPIVQARAEIEKCAATCRYFADHGEKLLQTEQIQTEARKSYVSFEPLGIVLAIMPWNFPFWQIFRAAIPALIAGNGILVKPAENTTGCALAIDALFRRAGFPKELYQTLLLSHLRIATLVSHPLIQGVTLTGSIRAGRHIAKLAGAALKKTVLELGGSDPLIVLADADLDLAVRIACQSRFMNSGQSCIAAKRFIVVNAIRDDFESSLYAAMEAMTMGDPLNEQHDIGPMARLDLRKALHRQVTTSIRHGARCRLGGIIPKGKGAFYPPTLLTGVKSGMPAYDEELFGPVAVIIAARDEAEAMRIANDTRFGLGATVVSKDRDHAEQLARERIAAGFCAVNDLVKSDPRLPFGGIKESGYGRELSAFGIREFVNVKTIVVA